MDQDARKIALGIAANAVERAAKDREPRPGGCDQCADAEAPLIDALLDISTRLGWEAMGKTDPVVRERLARHLYRKHWDGDPPQRWEVLPPNSTEHWLGRADEELAVIAGKEADHG